MTYLLYWTDIPESRALATFDSDRLALVVDHGLSSRAPFEVDRASGLWQDGEERGKWNIWKTKEK